MRCRKSWRRSPSSSDRCSLSLVDIFHKQVDYNWFIFSPPGFVSFVLLTIANIAEVNRKPFDLPEAESEIIAGYHTEYTWACGSACSSWLST